MTTYFLSPRAEEDLGGIWDYTVETWGLHQARGYTEEIRRSLELLAAHPERGKTIDYVRAGYRRYPTGAHIVFYKVIEGGIDVVRVLHRSMDIERHV